MGEPVVVWEGGGAGGDCGHGEGDEEMRGGVEEGDIFGAGAPRDLC